MRLSFSLLSWTEGVRYLFLVIAFISIWHFMLLYGKWAFTFLSSVYSVNRTVWCGLQAHVLGPWRLYSAINGDSDEIAVCLACWVKYQQTTFWIFFLFSKKMGFVFSCTLFAKENICVKCQILFAWKNEENTASLACSVKKSADDNLKNSSYTRK